MTQLPISSSPTAVYISHGGGPMPLLGDESHQEMIETLPIVASQLEKPAAIVLISAHWEADLPTITHSANPPLIYDYYGFPEPAYKIQYPALGEPTLADTIFSLFRKKGIDARLDRQRGFDHGLFVPLKLMYPAADIPCVQVSLVKGLDAKTHIAIGKALSLLANDNVLVIGSGFSFHNMQAFRTPSTPETAKKNEDFEQWLIGTCSSLEIDEAERTKRLVEWEQAPAARYCHPREEHLLPLHVCYGVAQRACTKFFELTILDKKASLYIW